MNKRKGIIPNSNNFRPANPFSAREETKGTKPTSDPATVQGILLGTLLHGCRRILFANTYYRVAIYTAVIFVSVIFDYTPLPRSYFSRSSNAFNQYFVKLGWMWTLIWTVPFVLLTSLTYCCGNWKIVKWHLTRIGIATAFWFCVTKSFVYYENNNGQCSVKNFSSKQSCLAAGHFWHSLDISGHAFILIYSSLVMIEEARAIIGWESIDHLIREEAHNRSKQERDLSSPLKNLDLEQMVYLNNAHIRFSPYVKAILIAMTLFTCLWDVMVFATALYFHKMVEKLLGGLIAIAVWYITYKFWYSKTKILPYAPGVGVFVYQGRRKNDKPIPMRRSVPVNVPLYGKAKQTNGQQPTQMEDDLGTNLFKDKGRNGPGGLLRNTARAEGLLM